MNVRTRLHSLAVTAGLSSAALIGCALDPATPIAQTARESGFDWGGNCSAGDGTFEADIPHQATSLIGTIPPGKRSVRIQLDSAVDVDIQLIDVSTGHEIIAWPNGDLNDASEGCTEFRKLTYCYSGYNGVGGALGNEWIEVRGDTNRELEMRAYGYAAGPARVSYTWEAVPTCSEVGSGTFTQAIPYQDTVTVGTIPPGKVNVSISLAADEDVDVQLIDTRTGREIIAWPNGELNGSGEACTTYEGANYCYSGYNGVGGALGNEWIRIDGLTNRELTMRAFGYAAGDATITYSWGNGVGQSCGSRGLPPCGPGLVCKNGDTGDIARDVPGTCHTETWCESDASAADDCAALIHPMVLGAWGCQEFQCAWVPEPDLGDLECSLFDKTCPAGYTCDAGCPTAAPCGINPDGVCRKNCEAASDCGGGEYCDAEGLCRADATCAVDADCNAEGNEWDFGVCIATTTPRNICGEGGTCSTICLPIELPACNDVADVAFGFCEMLLGWAPDSSAGACVPVSGCSANGYSFFPSQADCDAACQ